ncbi:50S ribosomal protein L24 [Youngiibacter multivorans]|uniref:Large ribosomal subunit protein uL24 n=1 Tax=Youngiibacter multivorans TaxID=937251 RepID=A0ABS4G3J3_9CLOT|nr:50S ribosomal protein L24 [Youngiibacter multivorans]MBP1919118.1 large subunit ribosomal protein L24 [Youngiibacter multivorans]MBW8383370.1 50S ribosomal protein L24 [Youngiibacter sp.]
MKVHVRKNDKVMVISGKDKGKISEVLSVMPKVGKVLVKDVNMVSKHKKPSKTNMQGGIISTEAPINSSKVMLYCEKCKSVTRISRKIMEDGSKVRVCKHCNAVL